MRQLHELVNTFGQDLKHRYGEKIHKLTLHGNFTCPNRDGTLGKGGCTFCNVSSFVEESASQLSVAEQLALRRGEVKQKAKRYLAYFQAYTSTYGEVKTIERLYEEALQATDMVGLCVGTRPDCVPESVLDLLSGYQQQGYEIWVELGLQSANDQTLKRINRGHDFSCYAETAERIQRRGFKLCTHLILGLPNETQTDWLKTLSQVINVGTQGIKLHPLHIVTGSTMAKVWQAGKLCAIEQTDYVEGAAQLITHTPKDVIYHRVSARARKPTLLAPDWCEERWRPLTAIANRLNEMGAQGCELGDPFDPNR